MACSVASAGPSVEPLIRLAVRCRPEQADLVLAELTVLAPNGVEEERGPGYVEYAIYGGEGELPELGDLDAAIAGGRVEVSSTEIPDDWADRWRDFHKPLLVADRLWLRPSWEPAREGAVDVVVDPGQAFGTGAHPTTRLCLGFLCELEVGGELVDLGTGSGVLAIAAAKLGWDPIRAYDHEPAAIEAAAANATANGVEIQLERINLRERLPDPAPTVVANMTSPILRAVAGQMAEPPQVLVCSGLLPHEQNEVAAAFASVGLEEAERRQDGDWAALLLHRR
jgi:ribosomal protein L11 methyltransferase